MRPHATRVTGDRWLSQAVLVLALLAGAGQAGAADDFAWRQFEGTTLRVLLKDDQWHQVMQVYYPEFEKLTGIKLAVEAYPQAKLWDVLERGLTEPGRVDVFMTVPALDGPRYLRLGRLRPVGDLLADPARTSSAFAWQDFLPQARAGMQVDGAVLGPPLMGEHFGLLYRKDVFAARQMVVPKTLAELEAAARTLHNTPADGKGKTMAGLVTRGAGGAATSLYAAVLHGMGGRWFDDRGQPMLTSQPSLDAAALIARLLRSYTPPGIREYGWQEASADFMAGGAAMYLEGGSVYLLLEEAKISSVAGKIGYALFPAGPAGPSTTFAVRGLAVGRHTQNPGAAWLFCQWAAGPDMVRRALQKDILVARESAWRDTATPRRVPADLAQAFQEAGQIGAVQWAPPMVAVTAGRQAVGELLDAAIRGEPVRPAAETGNRRLQEILRATEPAPRALVP